MANKKENPLLTGMKIIAEGDPISVGLDEIKDVAEKSIAAYEDWEKDNLTIGLEEMRKDKSEGSYYYSWQANIAMSFQDAVRNHLDKKNNGNLFDESFGDGALHEVANEAAKNFLDQLVNQ